jgi:hypothetical protein
VQNRCSDGNGNSKYGDFTMAAKWAAAGWNGGVFGGGAERRGKGNRKARQATADPYGMTNKRAGNGNNNGSSSGMGWRYLW